MLLTLLCAFSIHQPVARPLLLVHTMPWFTADKHELGWHWRMNKTSDEVLKSGRVASHFQPLIGAYESLDPDVIELQVSWMKLSGFDGVLADWYGVRADFDYPAIHERTIGLFKTATAAGLKIGVVYEDQSIGNAVREKQLKASESVSAAKQVGAFLGSDWLKRANWVRFSDRPAVLVFGPQAFKDPEWAGFQSGTGPIDLVTLHDQRAGAQGAYDWPIPSLGLKFQQDFVSRSAKWGIRVPIAFPRFQDYYEQGGQKGYPVIPDQDGKTYRETLRMALDAKPNAIQVATWNDWQEGTQIEPSVEFKYRDLVETQKARREIDPNFSYREDDLDLPLRIYKARKAGWSRIELQHASRAVLEGDLVSARKILADLKG